MDQLEARLVSLETARLSDNSGHSTNLARLESDTKVAIQQTVNQIQVIAGANNTLGDTIEDMKTKVEEVINRLADTQTQITADIQSKFDTAMAKIDQTFNQADAAMKAQGEGIKIEINQIQAKLQAAEAAFEVLRQGVTSTTATAMTQVQAMQTQVQDGVTKLQQAGVDIQANKDEMIKAVKESVSGGARMRSGLDKPITEYKAIGNLNVLT